MIESMILFCILSMKGPVIPTVQCIEDPEYAGLTYKVLRDAGFKVEIYEAVLSKGFNTRLEEFKRITVERIQ